MNISANTLKLAVLVTVAVMTMVTILFDADKGAQDAMTHMAAITIGALLHSMTGGLE